MSTTRTRAGLGTLSVALAATVAMVAMAMAASPVEETIRRLEQEQARAVAARDRAALEKIFAPEFTVLNPTGGTADRAQMMRILTEGQAPYSSATYETQAVRDMGEVVVTIGVESVVPNSGAQAGKTVQRRVSQVWKRYGGVWQLTLRHATVVVP